VSSKIMLLPWQEARPDVAHPGVVGRELDDPDRLPKRRAAVLELSV
jgi:hypothetical protein